MVKNELNKDEEDKSIIKLFNGASPRRIEWYKMFDDAYAINKGIVEI